jgi:ferritin-like metal-binding protein YciE
MPKRIKFVGLLFRYLASELNRTGRPSRWRPHPASGAIEKAMSFFSANLDTLRRIYMNQLRMLLSAAQQIQEVLPKMIEKATDTQLKQAFQSHLQEMEVQVLRLEEILRETTGEAKSTVCKVVAALINEGNDMIKDASDESVRDAALIAAAQRVERYEIAAYGDVRRFAQILGDMSHVELLDETIREERYIDHLLTRIANRVNRYDEKAA